MADLRGRKVTPHLAVNAHRTKTGKRRRTAIDGRTTRHPGYGVSQRVRKRIEEVFGWIKAAAGFAKTRFRGTGRVDAAFTLATAAYNLVRLPKLLAEAGPSRRRTTRSSAAGASSRPTCGSRTTWTSAAPRSWRCGPTATARSPSGPSRASLDIDYGPDEIGFAWAGFDEMTEVSGAGSAEIQDDGFLMIEFKYHLGDEAVLRAVRNPSSTAC